MNRSLARQSFGAGRIAEALSHAGQAEKLLRGSEIPYEALNLQLLAILKSFQDPMALTTAARVAALKQQVNGKAGEAATLLNSHLESSRKVTNRTVATRYIGHLAHAILAMDKRPRENRSLPDPVQLVTEALGTLPAPGTDYHRAVLLRILPAALMADGRKVDAAAALSRAIDIARKIHSLSLLAQCLQTRARDQMRPA